MPTISAYTSDELKREVDRVVREEGRNQAQVGQTALALYTSLPSSARRALLELTAGDGEAESEAIERAVEAFARALLNARWELTSRRIADHVQARGELRPGMTEDEIADLAVSMVEAGRQRSR